MIKIFDKKNTNHKICISSIENSLNSIIDHRFGRAVYFLILDEDGKLIKSIRNSGSYEMRGAGVAAAQSLINENVDVLISNNIGPNALRILSESQVEIFSAPTGISIKQAFDEWKNKKLSLIKTPSVAGGFGFGRGRRWK